MAREVFVYREGLGVIPRDEAPPLHAQHGTGAYVQSDSMAPIRSHADGRMYDSKSQYRRDLKARGLIEVGNERVERRPAPLPPVRETLRRTIQQLQR